VTDGGPSQWQPSASIQALQRRAELRATVRRFFATRGVLEVELPLLGEATVPDPHLHSVEARLPWSRPDRRLFLQTSPELFMKRLLAAGSGAIYSLDRAFRDGERGTRHRTEFTILEWYRPGWDHHRLIDEIDELVVATLDRPVGERRTYGELFDVHLGLDSHEATPVELADAAHAAGLDVDMADADPDEWRQLLFSHLIEPRLGHGRPTFVLDFPAGQAALARIRPGSPPVAERFELFVDGVELANGYHELIDAGEQRHRFEADLATRAQRGLPTPPLDRRFLAALGHGLPPCAGVALGFDRLVMLALGVDEIGEVIAFDDG